MKKKLFVLSSLFLSIVIPSYGENDVVYTEKYADLNEYKESHKDQYLSIIRAIEGHETETALGRYFSYEDLSDFHTEQHRILWEYIVLDRVFEIENSQKYMLDYEARGEHYDRILIYALDALGQIGNNDSVYVFRAVRVELDKLNCMEIYYSMQNINDVYAELIDAYLRYGGKENFDAAVNLACQFDRLMYSAYEEIRDSSVLDEKLFLRSSQYVPSSRALFFLEVQHPVLEASDVNYKNFDVLKNMLLKIDPSENSGVTMSLPKTSIISMKHYDLPMSNNPRDEEKPSVDIINEQELIYDYLKKQRESEKY